MSVNLSLFAGAGWQFFDNNGVPLAGGLIYQYAAGTTTPQTTYTTNLGNVAQANPIVLNASGRVPTGEIWLSEGLNYKFVLQDSNNVLIGTYDNINGTYIANDLANTTNPNLGDALVGFRQSGPSGNLLYSVGRTVHQKFQEMISVKDFGAVGDGVTDDTNAINNAIIAKASLGGGNVFVPIGTYNISSTIYLSNTSVTLVGEGGEWLASGAAQSFPSALFWTGSAGGIMISSDCLGRYSVISNICLNGNNSAGVGLNFDGPINGNNANILIEKMTIIGCDIGILLGEAGAANEVWIMYASMYNNIINVKVVNLDCYNVHISHCSLGYTAGRTTHQIYNVSGKLYITNTNLGSADYAIIETTGSSGMISMLNCYSEGNTGYLIKASNLYTNSNQVNLNIINCTFRNVGYTNNIAIQLDSTIEGHPNLNIVSSFFVGGINIDTPNTSNYWAFGAIIGSTFSTLTRPILTGTGCTRVNIQTLGYSAYNTGNYAGQSECVGLTPSLALTSVNAESSYFPYASFAIQAKNILLSNVSGANVTIANFIPFGSMVYGLTAMNETNLGTTNGVTGFKAGTPSATDLFGTANPAILFAYGINGYNSYSGGAMTSPTIIGNGSDLVITALGGNFDGTGNIRITLYYSNMSGGV